MKNFLPIFLLILILILQLMTFQNTIPPERQSCSVADVVFGDTPVYVGHIVDNDGNIIEFDSKNFRGVRLDKNIVLFPDTRIRVK